MLRKIVNQLFTLKFKFIKGNIRFDNLNFKLLTIESRKFKVEIRNFRVYYFSIRHRSCIIFADSIHIEQKVIIHKPFSKSEGYFYKIAIKIINTIETTSIRRKCYKIIDRCFILKFKSVKFSDKIILSDFIKGKGWASVVIKELGPIHLVKDYKILSHTFFNGITALNGQNDILSIKKVMIEALGNGYQSLFLEKIMVKNRRVSDKSLFYDNIEIQFKMSTQEGIFKLCLLIIVKDINVSIFSNLDEKDNLSLNIHFHELSINSLAGYSLLDSKMKKLLSNIGGVLELMSVKYFFNLHSPSSFHYDFNIRSNLSCTNANRNKIYQDFIDRGNIQFPSESKENVNIDLRLDFERMLIKSEDPNFFVHRGVDAKLLFYSLLVNIKDHKFTRGASTITMQLVRNLYLNYNKNLERKINEIVISLLLENVIIIDKKQIINKYLNIIEMGPGVFGINNASNFYFNKNPSNLTVEEWLTILYIIPRPKFFLSALNNKSPQLRSNFIKHVDFFKRKLNLENVSDHVIIKGHKIYLE